ncbi:MAG: bacteriohemerythrin, partial [[Bacteroides] pectinophilus]|nr:bacteriohemerythrin [[Bacteroides] pectinophilus]
TLAKLRDYAATHFAHEEEYMEKTSDPELARQRMEHASFVKKVDEMRGADIDESNAQEAVKDMLSYLIKWLYTHILSSDMMIGKLESLKNESTDVCEESKEDSKDGGMFAFTDRFRTGIEFVDDEHRKLFEIMAEANELIKADFLHDKYDKIMHILEELEEYTRHHFADEEEYMEQIGYPELEAQKRAHAAFVERLVEIDFTDIEAMDNNQQEYLTELMDFLVGWLTNHILKADMKIGEYVKR